VIYLVEVLTALGLVASGPATVQADDISRTLGRLANLSAGGDGEVLVEVARDDLNAVLNWVQRQVGEPGSAARE
jgi:hypothetical protein